MDESEAAAQELKSKEGEQMYRTVIMFSATMPKAVEELANK